MLSDCLHQPKPVKHTGAGAPTAARAILIPADSPAITWLPLVRVEALRFPRNTVVISKGVAGGISRSLEKHEGNAVVVSLGFRVVWVSAGGQD
jgi:hypothetical protein